MFFRRTSNIDKEEAQGKGLRAYPFDHLDSSGFSISSGQTAQGMKVKSVVRRVSS